MNGERGAGHRFLLTILSDWCCPSLSVIAEGASGALGANAMIVSAILMPCWHLSSLWIQAIGRNFDLSKANMAVLEWQMAVGCKTTTFLQDVDRPGGSHR